MDLGLEIAALALHFMTASAEPEQLLPRQQERIEIQYNYPLEERNSDADDEGHQTISAALMLACHVM